MNDRGGVQAAVAHDERHWRAVCAAFTVMTPLTLHADPIFQLFSHETPLMKLLEEAKTLSVRKMGAFHLDSKPESAKVVGMWLNTAMRNRSTHPAITFLSLLHTEIYIEQFRIRLLNFHDLSHGV